MFALKDQAEISGLLESAGFSDVGFESLSPAIFIGGGGTIDESMDFLLGMGMVRGLLSFAPASEHGTVIEGVRTTLRDHYEPGIGVRLGAAAFLVTAHA